MTEQRTKWAEDYFRGFASIPLTAECVFYSPQFLKGGFQKEVCDFLLILKGEAVLVSMKAQEDPKSRTGDKLKQWTIKERSARIRASPRCIANYQTKILLV
jgi:hypothetical protein